MISKSEAVAMMRAGWSAAVARVDVADASLGSIVNAASNATIAALPEKWQALSLAPASTAALADRIKHIAQRQRIVGEMHQIANLLHDELHRDMATYPPSAWPEVVRAFEDRLVETLNRHWIED